MRELSDETNKIVIINKSSEDQKNPQNILDVLTFMEHQSSHVMQSSRKSISVNKGIKTMFSIDQA